MFKLLILQSFTPPPPFTPCLLIVVVFPLYLFLHPLISSIAISSLSVHASLLPSFTMFFLSHYLPRICNLIAIQFFAASDT